MTGSRLDHVYRSILMTRFFTKGWGKPENLKRLFAFRKKVSNREACFRLVPKDYPITIVKEEEYSDCRIVEGEFLSPLVQHLPGLVPKEAEMAYFQMVLPKKWSSDHYKPICLHLAGTGDHGYWRRRQLMAKPLLKEAGIGAILLENPFYGPRKPKEQVRSNLLNVSDIFVMGGCLILECLALFHWCERSGLGPLGITGLSMGGHMASLAATNWPKPLVLVPCLSWSTASGVFTKGVMSGSINWELLRTQFLSDDVYRDEICKMVRVDEDDAFRAGQLFVQTYPESLERMAELQLGQVTQQVATEPAGDRDKPGFAQQGREMSTNAPPSLLAHFTESKSRLLGFRKKRRVQVDRESLQFMRGIMDECTHLGNFSRPIDTELIIAVCAQDDAYVPREDCVHLADIWPGTEVRYISGGHVSGYVLNQSAFRSAIIEGFQRLQRKYGLSV